MHTVFALLCFVVVIHWLIFPYPSGLLHWHGGNLTIAPVPAKQPWWIWINTSFEFIMNDYITTTKQSTTKPCASFLGYTVQIASYKLPSRADWLFSPFTPPILTLTFYTFLNNLGGNYRHYANTWINALFALFKILLELFLLMKCIQPLILNKYHLMNWSVLVHNYSCINNFATFLVKVQQKLWLRLSMHLICQLLPSPMTWCPWQDTGTQEAKLLPVLPLTPIGNHPVHQPQRSAAVHCV